MQTLEDLLQLLVQDGGSDLHVTAGSPPRLRVDGELKPIEGERLTPDLSKELVYSVLKAEQIARFERDLELDFSFGISGLGRFRTNVFQQRGAVGAVMRIVPWEVMPMDKLGLPRSLLERLCALPNVVTVEDPIEFVHRNKKCLFNQREVGTDTHGFAEALRSVLRQDPDVVLIGEMRDQETVDAALRISETGHLTFGTLHTSDCVQTINRIIDIFPSYQQAQIRTQLSFVLEAVFCQQLLARADGRGRVLAAEIMVCNSAVRSLIRDDKAHQIYSIIQTSGKLGMRTMNQSLFELYRAGLINYEESLAHTSDPEDLKRVFQKTL